MAYQPYADSVYYTDVYEGTDIPEEEQNKALKKASRHIDTLTYNRIIGRGISDFTEYQKDVIREVCCQIADFEYENEELINSVLQNYSINGVSMSFGSSWNVMVQNGIAVKRDTYELLCSTGLCCRVL